MKSVYSLAILSFFRSESILCSELINKALVILIKKAHVINFIFQQSDTLKAYTEREAGIYLRINAAHLQNVRMYHAAAENLNPAFALAQAAAFPVAVEAHNVHFGTRLGEREMMRTEFYFGILSEQLSCELCKCSL